MTNKCPLKVKTNWYFKLIYQKCFWIHNMFYYISDWYTNKSQCFRFPFLDCLRSLIVAQWTSHRGSAFWRPLQTSLVKTGRKCLGCRVIFYLILRPKNRLFSAGLRSRTSSLKFHRNQVACTWLASGSLYMRNINYRFVSNTSHIHSACTLWFYCLAILRYIREDLCQSAWIQSNSPVFVHQYFCNEETHFLPLWAFYFHFESL